MRVISSQQIVKLHSGSYLLQQDQLGLIERFPLLKESFMIKGMSDGLATVSGCKDISTASIGVIGFIIPFKLFLGLNHVCHYVL